MKALFLDIDGVLNSLCSAIQRQDICPWCTNNLDVILKRVSDLQIIVSSSWRNGETVESLKEKLRPHSNLLADRIVAFTPNLRYEHPRFNEIGFSIKKHTVERSVILDDHPIGGTGFEENGPHLFIQTDNTLGLTIYDAFKAIEHFVPDYKRPIALI